MSFLPQMRNRRVRTIVDVLHHRASTAPDDRAYIFLGDGETESGSLTFAELETRARVLAGHLLRHCKPGDRALLMYPSSLEFITAFFGCLIAGICPLALYPPSTDSRQALRVLGRMLRIVADASPTVALTTSAILPAVTSQLDEINEVPTMAWFASDALEVDGDPAFPPSPAPDQVAFLQYTSGSTSRPRGVLISHENLMFNERMVFLGGENREGDMSVSWLPVFHDMGLIAAMLQAMYAGMGCVLLSPIHFIKRPVRWLQAITTYRASYSGAPNFAYELCARKVTKEQKAPLDLSSWELGFTSSEPVLSETLDRFCAAFEPVGFRRRTLYPAYGLAEATVFVTGGRRGVDPIVKCFSRRALQEGRAEAPDAGGDAGVRLVSSGATFLDQRVAIVDPDARRRLPDLRVGEIWVSGGNVSPGYWRAHEATEEVFGGTIAGEGARRWLRTGDLGFLEDGDLFVTGRRKDLIIVAGRNHYPQDLERTVEECHPAVRPGCCAVFGIEHDTTEAVVAVVEIRPAGDSEDEDRRCREITEAITSAVALDHEVGLLEVCLLRPTTIPKTSSGKVRRHRCRELYLRGGLETALPRDRDRPRPGTDVDSEASDPTRSSGHDQNRKPTHE
jgi:acyl-CoA synthetase (AMP-forming)/AMP-acid ligase II